MKLCALSFIQIDLSDFLYFNNKSILYSSGKQHKNCILHSSLDLYLITSVSPLVYDLV